MEENIPSVAALEAGHQFPCVFVIKVFGDNNEAFPAAVMTVGKENLASPESATQKSRASSKGTHLCVSLSFEALSAEEVRSLYRAFITTQGVRFLM